MYLSYEEKFYVKKAVKISPMQSAGDLLSNVQDTDEAIDFSLKKSVQYHVRKERRGIRAYLLDDVEVDDTLGSLSCELPISHGLSATHGRFRTL